MTTAERVHREHDLRAREWWGLTPSNGRACPRSLAGLGHTEVRDFAGSAVCVCANPLLDHPRRWLDRDRRPVLTAEPYAAAGRALLALLERLTLLGLTVDVSARSPYFPGSTLLLLIRRTDALEGSARA